MLPKPLPMPPKVAKESEATAQKRAAPDDDDEVVEEPPAKRPRTNGAGSVSLPNVPFSPSKKRKLDEDGILLLETADEKVDGNTVDVIEID